MIRPDWGAPLAAPPGSVKGLRSAMYNTAFKYRLFILLALVWAVGAGSADAQRYVISEDSEMWLEGTSTVNSFECEAETLRFDHDVEHDIEATGFSVPGVSLVVPVHDLDCDNRRMNRDMRNALQADAFPEIRLDVFRMDLLPEAAADTESQDMPLVAFHGVMTLAGVSRDVTIRLAGWLDEQQRLHGQGTLDVKMTDFNVDPPTALFGLVKAHDDISIRFHLMADVAILNDDGQAGFGSIVDVSGGRVHADEGLAETVGKSNEH